MVIIGVIMTQYLFYWHCEMESRGKDWWRKWIENIDTLIKNFINHDIWLDLPGRYSYIHQSRFSIQGFGGVKHTKRDGGIDGIG